MLASSLTAIALIFIALLGWILVQHFARRFAARHSELGPAREEGGGCSLICLCKNTENCPKEKLLKALKLKRATLPSTEKELP